MTEKEEGHIPHHHALQRMISIARSISLVVATKAVMIRKEGGDIAARQARAVAVWAADDTDFII